MNIQLNGGPYDGMTFEDVNPDALTYHAQHDEARTGFEHVYVRLDSLPVGEPPMVNFGYEGAVTLKEGAGE